MMICRHPILIMATTTTVAAVTVKLDGNMNVMSRSNTWPMVVVQLERNDVGGNGGGGGGRGGGMHVTENGPSDDGPCTAVTDDLMGVGAVTADMCPLAPLSARKRATLQRHYYPEGDWGWVIAATAVAVHVINHGFQLSAAVTLMPAAEKYGQPVVNTGKCYLTDVIVNKFAGLNRLNY